MKMDGLIRYDVPAEIVCLWKKEEGERLLPIQELAVKRYGLFEGGSLLIQAPTSSGKTFIGEMAAVQTALRRKKAVYLVPLKALAEEKFRDFKAKYEDYGIRVIISSRDHREYDRDLEDGNFSIAIVVYEKLSQLLVRRPERLKEIELIIADELELLSDSERGGMVEILLTRIIRSNCRLIGLSAVIGGAEKLAEWMDAKLLSYDRRPTELRYGVLHDGVFRYRAYNEYSEAEESLVPIDSESTWEVLTQNVQSFVARDESCLVFVKAKHEARRGAELLADQIELPAANRAIASLQALEETRCRETLLHTLNSGVGFHTADLSPEERGIVEEAFRCGEIKAMVSTSTLAVGLNMPARNVFITADKWRYDRRFGMPWKAPILRTEYENMGGRAGRYGEGHAFGRSIMIASTPFDQETLWRRYIDGERESINPRLAQEPLEDYILQLVASRECQKEEELLEFLEATLTGQWVWRTLYTLEEIEFRIRAAINRATDAGMLSTDVEGKLQATPLGQTVATKGVSIATALELEKWIGESETRRWAEIDLILAAALTCDGRMFTVSLSTGEYEHAAYPEMLKRLTYGEEGSADVPLNRIRNCSMTPFFEEVRAIKVALFLQRWIEHESLTDLESEFSTMAGQILAAAEQISWLVDATATIAATLGCADTFSKHLAELSRRVQYGLREEALPLVGVLDRPLSRRSVIGLAAHNLHTPEGLQMADRRTLQQWMSKKDALTLIRWAQHMSEEMRATPPRPVDLLPSVVLAVDDRHPSEIKIQGKRVMLQEKQYRLIRLLAATPGECVPYDTIYDALWGDTVVENNQMHFQKRKLLERIAKVSPEHEGLIRTIPKHGYVLNLRDSQVELHLRKEASVV